MTDSAAITRLAPTAVQVQSSLRPMGKLVLTDPERRAVTAMTTGDAGHLVGHVEERAAMLATGDPDVRRRCLAKAAAVQEALAQQLSALLAASVARRDDRAVALLDRALTSATARYRSLMDQLRIESVASRRVSVLAKGLVAITAEEGP